MTAPDGLLGELMITMRVLAVDVALHHLGG